MGISVAGNTTAASVSLAKPRASVAIVLPSATAVVAVPVSSISYIELAVGAYLDTTGRYRFIADVAAVIDSKSIAFSKQLSDSFAPQSHYRYELAKALFDEVLTPDALARDVSKLLADAYGVSEDLVFDLAKSVFDSAGVDDQSTRLLAKLIRDGVGMNDHFDVGDGSTYSFAKALINVVFANEQLARDVSKKLQDSFAALSRPMLHVEKAPFVDGVSSSDLFARTPELGKFDSVSTADDSSMDVTKLVTDLFAVTEVIGWVISKPYSDTLSIGDLPSVTAQKPVADSVSTSDVDSYDLSKMLSDSVGMVDVVTTVLVFIRNPQDSVSALDAGLLVNQGYCDLTYFAEDYVGVARSF